MSIADQITTLTTIRGDIRTALVAKGVDASAHNYEDFAADISSIPSGGIDGQYIIGNGTPFINPVEYNN